MAQKIPIRSTSIQRPKRSAPVDPVQEVAVDEEEPGTGGAWKFFVAVGIIMLLMIGLAAYKTYTVNKERASNQYNGFDFAQAQGGLWVTRIQVSNQPYDIPFYHHPRETEIVIVHKGVTDPILLGGPREVVLSIDPDAGSQPVVAAVEISRITGSKYDLLNIPTRSALSRQAKEHIDIPVVDCKDATNETVVVQLVHDPQANAIVRDGQCIILFYKTPEDSILVADRYAYMLLKMMN